MPLKYFPLTRIKTDLYTRGNEFITPDGAPYSGRYYETYNNKAFTGISPVLGESIPLIRKAQPRGNTQIGGANSAFANDYVALNLAKQATDSLSVDAKLTFLAPYYPIPLDSDYARGYFTRYFAKTVSGPGYVIEISQLDWSKIQDGNVNTTVLGYETMDMLWQLTGPLNDTRKSQYQIVGGVFSTNKRVTEAKQRSFRGIIEFIGGDYVKYARITP
jgi:hypothetical protein